MMELGEGCCSWEKGEEVRDGGRTERMEGR